MNTISVRNMRYIVRGLVTHAIARGYSVSVYEGGDWAIEKSTSVKDIMNSIMSTDSDTFCIYNAEKVKVGHVYCIYCNSDYEVIADYTDSPLMQSILVEALRRANRIEELS
ncbi:hypothetical protein RVBP17_3710 [Pseudomonas phage sp. 30-3]|uniref:Uncharacterized protein n=1 Tax=Pseudomonas phage vB_PaeM_PA5oct TaxID=2163605 RepID=A0A4Y5JU52_9CAUD|nr:hypothetical protein PQE65_gp420 [Pseudomonas phage vB_PaeM_PA5oct]QCG75945.1 hypothetical protein EST35_0062 [Pseudomonas phage vB_PaeM_PA5oct]BDR26328.1 hypothetical protein RVBP17_3710 [Pseudomonas phage sp. 30-3]